MPICALHRRCRPRTKADHKTNSWLALVFVLMLAASRHSFAQEPLPAAAPVLRLEDCVHTALVNQPAIRAREAAANKAEHQRAIAHSYFYPRVDLNLRFTGLSQPLAARTPNPISGQAADVFSDAAAFFAIARQAGPAAANAALANPAAPPFATAKQAALAGIPDSLQTDILGNQFLVNQVSLVQPLWTGGKIRDRHEQARLGARAAALDEQKARQETIFNVTRSYWGVVLAQAMIEVADESGAEAFAVEEVANHLVKVGNAHVNTPDVMRARTLRRLIENERIGASRLQQTAGAALRQAMGLPLDTPFELGDQSLDVAPQPIAVQQVLAEAYMRRPEVAKTHIGEQIALLERKLAQAEYAPDIAAFASYVNLAGDQGILDPGNPNLYSGGISVDVPIFQGGRRVAKRRQAQEQVAEARHTTDLVMQLIALEVQQAVLEYEEATAKLANGASAVKEAQTALEAYWSQYKGDLVRQDQMPGLFKDILETRLLLTRAQIEYNQALFGVHLALAKIHLAAANEDVLSQSYAAPPGQPVDAGGTVGSR